MWFSTFLQYYKKDRCRCVGGACWIVCLFACVKVEVDRIAEHDKAVRRYVAPPLGLISFPQPCRSVSFCFSLIFAAQCIELDPLPLRPGIWGREGAGETAKKEGGKGMMAVKRGGKVCIDQLFPHSLSRSFRPVFLRESLCRLNNVLIRGLDWITDGPDVTTLPSTSYI